MDQAAQQPNINPQSDGSGPVAPSQPSDTRLLSPDVVRLQQVLAHFEQAAAAVDTNATIADVQHSIESLRQRNLWRALVGNAVSAAIVGNFRLANAELRNAAATDIAATASITGDEQAQTEQARREQAISMARNLLLAMQRSAVPIVTTQPAQNSEQSHEDSRTNANTHGYGVQSSSVSSSNTPAAPAWQSELEGFNYTVLADLLGIPGEWDKDTKITALATAAQLHQAANDAELQRIIASADLIKALYANAVTAWKAGDYPSARRYLQQVKELDPTYPDQAYLAEKLDTIAQIQTAAAHSDFTIVNQKLNSLARMEGNGSSRHTAERQQLVDDLIGQADTEINARKYQAAEPLLYNTLLLKPGYRPAQDRKAQVEDKIRTQKQEQDPTVIAVNQLSQRVGTLESRSTLITPNPDMAVSRTEYLKLQQRVNSRGSAGLVTIALVCGLLGLLLGGTGTALTLLRSNSTPTPTQVAAATASITPTVSAADATNTAIAAVLQSLTPTGAPITDTPVSGTTTETPTVELPTPPVSETPAPTISPTITLTASATTSPTTPAAGTTPTTIATPTTTITPTATPAAPALSVTGTLALSGTTAPEGNPVTSGKITGMLTLTIENGTLGAYTITSDAVSLSDISYTYSATNKLVVFTAIGSVVLSTSQNGKPNNSPNATLTVSGQLPLGSGESRTGKLQISGSISNTDKSLDVAVGGNAELTIKSGTFATGGDVAGDGTFTLQNAAAASK